MPCLLVQDACASTVSLTENVQREAMHPADQFEAFVALVAEGRPIEDIAADFAVTPLVVQRRLKMCIRDSFYGFNVAVTIGGYCELAK